MKSKIKNGRVPSEPMNGSDHMILANKPDAPYPSLIKMILFKTVERELKQPA